MLPWLKAKRLRPRERDTTAAIRLMDFIVFCWFDAWPLGIVSSGREIMAR
jgi:hypothetical protein